MDEVVQNVYVRAGGVDVIERIDVPFDDVDVAPPWHISQFLGVANQNPNVKPSFEKPWHKSTTDIAG
jgi:hypothetical protein